MSPVIRLSVLGILAAVALVAACSTNGSVGSDVDAGVDSSIGVFVPPAPAVDAGDDAPFTQKSYCPTNECVSPYATCPTSRFACDIDLASDPNNCGSCGFSCNPTSGQFGATFVCADGKCKMSCTTGNSGLPFADCNGVTDDGCEIELGTNDNCNACGDKCPSSDPAKGCFWDPVAKNGQCGCDPGTTYCAGQCLDVQSDDNNCGACGNVCDPDADGGILPPNSRYGCKNGACGYLHCEPGFLDCDNDLLPKKTSNGCESSTLDPKTCGTCKNACKPGVACGEDSFAGIECICPDGQLNCGSADYPFCTAIASDPTNCGGCGIHCSNDTSTDQSANHSSAVCVTGLCSFTCLPGWGDCNGNTEDGCEIDLLSDPRNCGACGHVCDGVAGQACIKGTCAVIPCDAGVPR